MRCILCGADAPLLFSHQEFDLHWCSACELGRLAGDFTSEQVAAFYQGDYYTHSTLVNEAIHRSFADSALLSLAGRLDGSIRFHPSEVPGKSACDIGCGSGKNLRLLESAGLRAIGIEPDEKAAQAARDAGSTVICGHAESLPDVGKFDIVLMSHVLEHCIDPAKAIGNAKTILSDDGTLVVEVPNNSSLGFHWFKGDWPWTDVPRHLSFFTEKSLRILFSQFGLEIIKVTYLGYWRQFTPEWRNRVPGIRSGWPLLVASALREPSAKYDSIRVHAIKAG